MAIHAITVGATTSDLLAQVPEGAHRGTGILLNADDENISLHQGGDAGVTPVPATYSTVTLALTGAPGTVIPAGSRAREPGSDIYWALDSETTLDAQGEASAAATCSEIGAIDADAESITEIKDDVIDVQATKSVVDLLFSGTDGTIVAIGRQVKKAADAQTWSVTEAGVISGEIAATESTADVTLTGAQGTVYPAGTHVKKAADPQLWATDEEVEVVNGEVDSPSTATVTLTGAQGTVYPIGTDVKKAAVATIWNTDEEAEIENGVDATYGTGTITCTIDTTDGEVTIPAGSAVKKAGEAETWETDEAIVRPAATAGTCLQVDLLGTPATVIAAGKRICKAADAATGPYWALDAEATIGVGGFVKANFTCTTKGALAAAAYSLDTIKDAVAGWTGCENDNAATPGVEASYSVDVGVTCDTLGAIARAAHDLDTIVDTVSGWDACDNAAMVTPGLDAADGTVDVGVTCSVDGPTAAAAHSLDTLPTPPAGHTSCDNADAATPGTTAADGTVDVGVTCETAGAIAALAHTLDTLPTPPVGHTSCDNALAATVGQAHVDGTCSVAAECDLAGKIAAAAHELDTFVGAHVGLTSVDNAMEATEGVDQEGWDTVTNLAEATPGDDYVPGTDEDITLVPIGSVGMNWIEVNLEQDEIGCICSSGGKLLQLMTGPNRHFGGFMWGT